MGKHDNYAHSMHITKQMKFQAPKPDEQAMHQHNQPPQAPPRKSNANNRYLSQGRGH